MRRGSEIVKKIQYYWLFFNPPNANLFHQHCAYQSNSVIIIKPSHNLIIQVGNFSSKSFLFIRSSIPTMLVFLQRFPPCLLFSQSAEITNTWTPTFLPFRQAVTSLWIRYRRTPFNSVFSFPLSLGLQRMML